MANEVQSSALVKPKESVDNVMSNITPWQTPAKTSMSKETVKNVVFTWLEDSLRDVKDNAQTEGFEAVVSTQAQPVTRQNTTQIFSETYGVTRTTDKMAVYGRARESARLAKNVLRALNRDVEYALVGTGQASTLDNGNGVRKMAGMQAQIDPSMVVTAGTPANGDTPATPAPLTEDMVLEASQLAFDAGAEPSIILVKSADSRRFADFAYTTPTGASTGRQRQVQGKTLINSVTLYQSPFGDLKVVIDRFLRPTDAIVYDPSMWSFVTFDPFQSKPLAKTGDTDRTMIVGEVSCKNRNFKSSALITNLS